MLTFPLKAALDSLDFYLHIFIWAGITDLFSSGALGVCWWAIDNLKVEGKRLWLSSIAVKGKNALTVIKESRWSIISVLTVPVMDFLRVCFSAVFAEV